MDQRYLAKADLHTRAGTARDAATVRTGCGPVPLYESGRCAVAHAFADPLVDPDDLADLRRLSADLDVVRALAEYLIEHELHVPRYP